MCLFLVYLQTPPKIAYDRIKRRGRTEENTIQMPFLENLHSLHEDWLIHRNSTTTTKIPASRYASINNTSLYKWIIYLFIYWYIYYILYIYTFRLIVINTAAPFDDMMKLYHKFAEGIWNLVPSGVKNDCSQQVKEF